MNFIKQIERLQLLSKLICDQNTGSPKELSARLGISRRQLYSHFEELKYLGLDISFSRKLNSFYFTDRKQLKIEFKLEVLESQEKLKISGGKYINLLSCFFYARNKLNLVV